MVVKDTNPCSLSIQDKHQPYYFWLQHLRFLLGFITHLCHQLLMVGYQKQKPPMSELFWVIETCMTPHYQAWVTGMAKKLYYGFFLFFSHFNTIWMITKFFWKHYYWTKQNLVIPGLSGWHRWCECDCLRGDFWHHPLLWAGYNHGRTRWR